MRDWPRRRAARAWVGASLAWATLLCAASASAQEPALRDNFRGRLQAVGEQLDQTRQLQVPLQALSPELLLQSFGPRPEPQSLFFFVRDQIRFEPYEGSRRGARGALLSRAGNSLDQALLLQLLLQGAGVEARLAWGSLDAKKSAELLREFSGQGALSPAPPAGAELYRVAEDRALRRAVERHYWVEALIDKQWIALDPSWPRSTYAVTATARQGTADAPPPEEQVSLTVRVLAREEGAAADKELLWLSKPLPELSWRNLTLRFRATGARAELQEPRLVISGEPTVGKPFKRQGVQRIWVEFLFDRGAKARQIVTRDLYRAQSHQDLFAADQQVFSLMVAPGQSNPWFLTEVARRELERLLQRGDAAYKEIFLDPERALRERELSAQLNAWVEDLLGGAAGLMTLAFAQTSDELTARLADALGVRAFYDQPRVLIVAGVRRADRLFWQMDLRHDEIRAVPADGLPAALAPALHAWRGRLNAHLEGEALQEMTGARVLSAAGLLQRAPEGRWLTAWPGNLDKLSAAVQKHAPEAALHLDDAVRQRGRAALLPAAPVPAGDRAVLAWWELSPEGHLLAVKEDGTHGAFSESMLTGAPGVAPEPSSDPFDLGFNQSLILLESLTTSFADILQRRQRRCPLICATRADLARLPAQLCLPAAPPAPSPQAALDCLSPPKEKKKSNDFLDLGIGQSCEALTRPARCGAVVGEQLLSGAWRPALTQAPAGLPPGPLAPPALPPLMDDCRCP
jgi:hypothetical protein